MTKQQMLNTMCRLELSQADVKAIGQSRGFETGVLGSRALLQHVFLTEQGVRAVLSSLSDKEMLGLHLLNHLADMVDVEFFKRVYPGSGADRHFASHTARFKNLIQQVKTHLVRRGILLCCALPESWVKKSVSERLRFRFPEEFAPCLPPPFQPRRLAAGAPRQYRKEVAREKLAEILELGRAPANKPAEGEDASWRLADGELLFGGKPFRVERFKAWPVTRLNATFPGNAKEHEFQPVALLLYAFSRLADGEWLAPEDLLPLWNLGFSNKKAPEPRNLCEKGFEYGLLEKAEQDGVGLYRWHGFVESTDETPPEHFLTCDHSPGVRICLERVPQQALEWLSEFASFKIAEGALRAAPSLLKMSHAGSAALESPVFRWLRQSDPGFKTAAETIEQRRGKLIVHQNLLVAKVSDPALEVMLEKQFGAVGQVAALSNGYLAFPSGLLPQIQAWMKKSGHVIKTVSTHDTD